jgi:hypothetical protein
MEFKVHWDRANNGNDSIMFTASYNTSDANFKLVTSPIWLENNMQNIQLVASKFVFNVMIHKPARLCFYNIHDEICEWVYNEATNTLEYEHETSPTIKFKVTDKIVSELLKVPMFIEEFNDP